MKFMGSTPISPGPSLAWADFSAATLSILCLLHCVTLPFLTPLLPLAGHLAGNESIHRALVWVAVPVSLTVSLTTLFTQKRRRALILAITLWGGLSMLIAALTEPFADYERPLTIAGSLTLAAAHLWHWLQAREHHIFVDEVGG